MCSSLSSRSRVPLLRASSASSQALSQHRTSAYSILNSGMELTYFSFRIIASRDDVTMLLRRIFVNLSSRKNSSWHNSSVPTYTSTVYKFHRPCCRRIADSFVAHIRQFPVTAFPKVFFTSRTRCMMDPSGSSI